MTPHDWLLVALNGSFVPPQIGMMLANEGLMYLPEGSKMYQLTERGEEVARERKERSKPKRASAMSFCLGCKTMVPEDHVCPAAASYVDPVEAEPEPVSLDGEYAVRLIWDRPDAVPEFAQFDALVPAFEFFNSKILEKLKRGDRVRLELDIKRHGAG